MMIKKKFSTIGEIQRIQQLATQTDCDVAIHSLDNSIRIDAKSFIGMFALNFDEPVYVVCECANFIERIKEVGETL